MANILHWADYLVFVVALLLSVSIGILYAAKERNSSGNRTNRFFLAGREMSVLPVSVSMFVSWLSAIAFLGDPVEVYYHGTVYIYLGVGYALACPVAGYFFAPFYHSLKIISVFELLYLGVALYGPSVALSQVTGVSVWIFILILGIVGTFYTTLGGMKAVLWVDTFQSLVMLSGIVVLMSVGAYRVGGFLQVFQTAAEHNRLNFHKLEASPLVRANMWSYLLGGFFRVLVPYISMQSIVQRCSASATAKDAANAIYLNTPLYFLLVILFTITGLVMFAYYVGCDPLKEGRITTPDQLVPLFMVDVLGFLPGVTGLFLACLCSASLSTLSSCLNGISANVLVDTILPLHKYLGNESYSRIRDTTQLSLAKLITVISGIIATCLGFIVLHSKDDIFPMTVKITGVFGSPIGALFFMGKVCPFVDTPTASIGTIVGLAISIWWGIGAILHPLASQALALSSDMCDVTTGYSSLVNNTDIVLYAYENASVSNTIITESPQQNKSENGFTTTDIYGISPLLFAPLGFITTFIVALAVAGIKECYKRIFCKIESRQQYNMDGLLKDDQQNS